MVTQQIHMQVIAALGFLEGDEEVYSLLNYAGSTFAQSLKPVLDHWKTLSPDCLSKTLQQSLKAFRAQESFSGIAEIHPAWLLDALKKESPRVIGVILRHLPSKQVRYLLEHLPRHTVMRLPKLIEAFYVPTEILNLIRQRFERRFVSMWIPEEIRVFEFQHLYYLKMEELELLFRDLGLSELALSLVGSPRRVLKVIVNRFSIRDAKEILSRLKRFGGEEKWLLKDAKYSILTLGGEEIGVECFLRELGLQALSKAFTASGLFLFEAIRQKLSPESAYLLKRCLDEQWLSPNTDKALRRQGWVMEHVQQLSGGGKINPLWQEVLKREAA